MNSQVLNWLGSYWWVLVLVGLLAGYNEVVFFKFCSVGTGASFGWKGSKRVPSCRKSKNFLTGNTLH